MAANENKMCDGVPMNLEQIQFYLQGHFGVPTALRLKGTTNSLSILL
jgi:hypothetical protein